MAILHRFYSNKQPRYKYTQTTLMLTYFPHWAWLCRLPCPQCWGPHSRTGQHPRAGPRRWGVCSYPPPLWTSSEAIPPEAYHPSNTTHLKSRSCFTIPKNKKWFQLKLRGSDSSLLSLIRIHSCSHLSPLDSRFGSARHLTVECCWLSYHGVDVMNQVAELRWVDSLGSILFLHHCQLGLTLDGAVHVVGLHHEHAGILGKDLWDV